MRVIVCGSRDWLDESAIQERLEKLPPGSVVMHGACRGADQIAGKLALNMGFVVESYPADWAEHGLSAGPIRNARMLEEKPDLVIAFALPGSKGTQNMINQAERRKIPVERFPILEKRKVK